MERTSVLWRTVLALAVLLALSFILMRDKFRRAGLNFSVAENKIAIIPVDDEIESPARLVRILDHYRDDISGVGAVVLAINSPGGGVAAAQEICDAIDALKDSGVTVVAALGSVAASGGYYVACPADRIVANAGTLTGSIGVIMQTFNARKVLEKIGLDVDVVKSGEFKDSGSLFRSLTARERTLFQEVIDDVYAQFIETVATRRRDALASVLAKRKHVPETRVSDADVRDYVKSFSDGRIFSGRKAMALGLVDELGSLQHAIEVAADLAGIEDPEVITYRESRPLAQWITGLSRADLRDWLKQSLGVHSTRRLGYLAW